MNGADRYHDFLQMNRNLLNCYGKDGVVPSQYKGMTPMEQGQWCAAERKQLEEVLIKGKISA